jgi:hypothetical protein
MCSASGGKILPVDPITGNSAVFMTANAGCEQVPERAPRLKEGQSVDLSRELGR